MNHRVLKLNFGYEQYFEYFNVSLYDPFDGELLGFEERTHFYRRWDAPGPYLEYDSQFGENGRAGDPRDGRLTEPMVLQVYRHYLVVMENGKDSLSVFSFPLNNSCMPVPQESGVP